MKKSFLLKFFVLVLILTGSRVYSQTQITDITDNFFSKYAKDLMKAFDYAFSTNKYFDLKDNAVNDLKVKLKTAVEQCGKYYGYEPIMEKTSGTCMKIISFFVKYERQPIRLTFIFYKPNEKWQVQNLSFSADFDNELEDAIKLNVTPIQK